MRAWLLYSVARVGIFAAIFLVLYFLLGATWWWVAAASAALMAAAISFLALGRVRGEVSTRLATSRERRGAVDDPDAVAEDSEAETTAAKPLPGADTAR
jgi:cell division protein FtsW (lipid II flippase)